MSKQSGMRVCAGGLAALCVLSLGVSAHAQSVQPRAVAARGDPNVSVTETEIIAGTNEVIALAMHFDEGTMRYAVYDIATGLWSQGTIPGGSAADPSIAFDSMTGDFVAAANAVRTSRYSNGGFSPWQSVDTPSGTERFDTSHTSCRAR